MATTIPPLSGLEEDDPTPLEVLSRLCVEGMTVRLVDGEVVHGSYSGHTAEWLTMYSSERGYFLIRWTAVAILESKVKRHSYSGDPAM